MDIEDGTAVICAIEFIINDLLEASSSSSEENFRNPKHMIQI